MQMKAVQSGDAIDTDGSSYSYNYEDLIKAMSSKDVVDVKFDDEEDEDEEDRDEDDESGPSKKKK